MPSNIKYEIFLSQNLYVYGGLLRCEHKTLTIVLGFVQS